MTAEGAVIRAIWRGGEIEAERESKEGREGEHAGVILTRR
jgi:hypothetical protein